MGAGHSGISRELARQLAEHGHRSRTVDFIDALPPAYGPAMRAIYRGQLRYAPWSYDAMYRLRFRYPYLWDQVNAWYVLLSGRRLLRWVRDMEADVVLSVYPLASAVLGELRRDGRLPVPVLTYITDLGVHPLWVSSGVDLHLTVHPEAAGQAARRAGGPACTCAPLSVSGSLKPSTGSMPTAGLGWIPAGHWPWWWPGRGAWAGWSGRSKRWPPPALIPSPYAGRDSALRRRIAALGHGTALGGPTICRR